MTLLRPFQFLLLAALLAFAMPALAIFTEKPLEDPQKEARAQELMKELRCLVCQNQAISESHAPLARDLRVLLRERIAAGDTNEEARDYMVARYGDWVLLDTPMKATTYLLWFGPLLILVPGLIISAVYLRRRRAAGRTGGGNEAPLTEAERAELDRALSDQR
ncbi:cytochrome c-type biogenesis protein [Minwuia thermotolerans]|uniref:Cytochrome c-type biogenesis protein n=1 Tax=Minwuia thermotolerans TaxID=2056226 RepID=A0A2M9G5P3_9PROT|nr:cytochrome c-type biogenesis protein [Minwuia thermotolerans]PJK31022.1 cytochrome C biogenesis protein CcmH [Minwuia thermotolerans]